MTSFARRLTAALRPLDRARQPLPHTPRKDNLEAAAVLVALERQGEEWFVLLTIRTTRLSAHPGQVSFPGGRVDPGDRDLVATALRETAEETAIADDYVELLGCLDDYQTITGYHVTPVVGLLKPGYRLNPDPAEVATLFWMPLSLALDRDLYRQESVILDGRPRHFYVQKFAGHAVWGATAAMLLNLGGRLADQDPALPFSAGSG